MFEPFLLNLTTGALLSLVILREISAECWARQFIAIDRLHILS